MSTLVTIQLEKCEFKAQFWTLTQLEKSLKTEQGYFRVAKERAEAQKMLRVADIGQRNRITCRMTHTKTPQTVTQTGAASAPHPL